MNKTQKESKLKMKREFARLRKMAKARVEEDELMDDDFEVGNEQLSVSGESPSQPPPNGREQFGGGENQVHKEYMGEMYLGPTSFEELDAIETAQEQAHEVNEISWKVSDLVYNIVNNPMMKPKEKSSAIKQVGDGFEARVSAVLSGKEIEKDLDVLSIEALLAQDGRKTGLLEKAKDWINGKNPKAVLRKNLAQTAQQIKAGGTEAEKARAELPRLRAEAKALGIETSIEKEKTGIIIEKDAKGDWRWIGWSTNKFLDFDGEILAESAHKEYSEWLDTNQEMSPVFMSWHTPATVRKNAVDFWTYENGFLMMSGALTEAEAGDLLRVQKEIDLGMSHGTIVLERDPQNKKVITKYRMFEVSELPLENAANPFTSFETVIKEADMDKRKYFADLFGEEKAQKYLALTKDAEAKLEDAGVASKEAPPLSVSTPTSPQLEKNKLGGGASPLSAADMEAVVKAVGEKYGMDDLNAYLTQAQEAIEKVPLLEELVKSLADNQDETLAEKISPKGGAFIWVNKARASQGSETKLKDGDAADEKLRKSAPTIDPVNDWLAVQTGIAPIPQQ